MSKMSQLHMELSESASDLGFASIEEAEQAGYIADYNTGTMYKPCPLNELAKAHETWSKEKEKVLASLSLLRDQLSNEVSHYNIMGKDDWEIIEDTINFIKKGEI